MAQTKRANPMDDIARQARQGSLAAIIQVLNEKLANSGVRTRAIIVDGILQLLCEGQKAEELEQSQLVGEIRQILEAIAPRNISRVNINCRIVREQQLLWLEEISRDPEGQLLWSKQITLAKPNIFKRLGEDLRNRKTTQTQQRETISPSTPRFVREKRVFWSGILIGGMSLLGISLLLRWAVNDLLSPKASDLIPSQTAKSQPKTGQSPLSPNSEPFAEAVRLAEQAASMGKDVKSAAQWLDLAAKWQKASDLMASLPSTDSRYKTAQNRVKLYSKNSEAALQEAKKLRSQP